MHCSGRQACTQDSGTEGEWGWIGNGNGSLLTIFAQLLFSAVSRLHLAALIVLRGVLGWVLPLRLGLGPAMASLFLFEAFLAPRPRWAEHALTMALYAGFGRFAC